ncbi:MAG: hypothetical protein PVI26_01080 [Chitinispirillia bacterium]
MKKHKVKKIIPVLAIFLFLSLTIEGTDQKASYLIVKNPTAFTILNKYEQDITAAEKKTFIAYSPLKILSRNTTLGDQLSQALKFQFQNKIYFLLRNENGKLIGLKNTGYRKILQNCIHINDTIRILRGNVLRLSEQSPTQGKGTYLLKNDILIRIFRYKNSYFLLRLGDTNQYGWCNLSPKSTWQKYAKKQESKTIVISNSIRNRIESKIKSVNEMYVNFFDYFNRIEGKSKSIPQWIISSQENILQISLHKNIGYLNQMAESTDILIKDLENILIGEPFLVKQLNGVISIEPEKR